MIELERIKKNDPQLQDWMACHYSQPKGFVGRQLLYKIHYGTQVLGATGGGSCILHLPKRNEFFGDIPRNSIVNNVFFHIEQPKEGYPLRNFASNVVKIWRQHILNDWKSVYGDDVLGFETLVEPPRTGEVYRRDGWSQVAVTKGYTCKRTGGKGSDGWGGQRVWDKDHLRPKLVFYRKP